MNRYLYSFILTLGLFVIAASVFYSFNQLKTIPIQPNKTDKILRVVLLEKETPKPKKTTQKKQKQKSAFKKIEQKKKLQPNKKTVSKKIIAKIEKQKEMKKREVIKEKVLESEIMEKTIAKKIISKETPIVKQAIKKPTVDFQQILFQKNSYFTTIKSILNKNKSYPAIARKRGIQGDVKIEFVLSKNGELISYKIVKGKQIFKKSIQSAIEKSFPLKPPQNLFDTNLNFTLTVQFRLYS